jgi:ATP-dependent protease ClpP protease subunit
MPIEVRAAKDESTLYVYGGIGMPDQNGYLVDASEFVSAVAAQSTKSLTVRLATVGGDPVAAGAMYQALVDHPAHVRTVVDSRAYSAGSMLVQAGDERLARPLAMMMVHAPHMKGGGNAKQMRDAASALDAHAEMMVTAYTRHGIDEKVVRGWVESDSDVYFSATEAVKAGLIDAIDEGEDLAAIGAPKTYAIAAMATNDAAVKKPQIQHKQQEPDMADNETPATPEVAEPKTIVSAYNKAQKTGQVDGAKKENERIQAILQLKERPTFQPPQVQAVLDSCIADPKCDRVTAMDRAVSALEELPENAPIYAGSEPADNGGAYDYQPKPAAIPVSSAHRAPAPRATGGKSRSAEGIRAALEIRSGIEKDRDVIEKERSNEFLSMSMVDLMSRELRGMGHRVGGTREDIARAYCNAALVFAAGPSHGTDHLTGILADVANKSAQQGWMEADETWQEWTVSGTLNDYRAAQRANLALLDKLDKMIEGKEWEYGDLADVKQSIQGFFYGKKYGLTIQSIVNDDLGELTRAFSAWGEAANATVGDAVFTLLTAAGSGGFGQSMDEDSTVLFHADHSNYVASSSGGAPASATIAAGRTAMMTQLDPNARTVGIRPAYILHGGTLTPTVAPLLSSAQLITGADGTLPANNWVSGLGLRSVEDYRFDGWTTALAWILAAARRTVEVSGVAGPLSPRVDRSAVSNIPGITYEMSMPFGAAVLDYRGFYFNYGS